DIAYLQAKSHTAEGSLLAELGHGVTTLEQAGFHHLDRLRGSQLGQGCASTRLCSPLLRLLPCQFHTFLRSQLLRDTVLRSTECLQRRWADRNSLENIVCAVLPLLSIHAKFGHGENTLHEVRHALHAFHPSSSRDKRGSHDLELMLLSQLGKLLWIGL